MKYLILIFITNLLFSQTTPFEKNKNYSATYEETISFYNELASKYNEISIEPYGSTDAGLPLHLVMYSSDGNFDRKHIDSLNRLKVFIINGIHAGEPCGVDASMLLFKDLVLNQELNKNAENVFIALIPIYNVGGALLRNSYTRANQVGPEAYGFRGNAKNYNLNRDFVKMDTKNTESFIKLFHNIDPDIFVDTHTSDGSDYQHVMTFLPTQYNRLGKLGEYMRKDFDPKVYKRMDEKGFPMTPYVTTAQAIPDSGIIGFVDPPRFSVGYTSLFNSLSYTTEAHMLKPFEERVLSTKAILETFIEVGAQNKDEIKSQREKNFNVFTNKYPEQWDLDQSRYDEIDFMGYEAYQAPSALTDQTRWFYNTDKPYTKKIKYFNHYKAKDSVDIPEKVVIPKVQDEILIRLYRSGVNFKVFEKDTVLVVKKIKILDQENINRAYEGHYIHTSVNYEFEVDEIIARKGDYYFETNQRSKRYIMETLVPDMPDSFFRWNFFDRHLRQLEYYSSYIFEKKAVEFLKNHPEIKVEFEKKMSNEEFAKDPRAQLNFIYAISPHMEPSYMTLPYYFWD